MTDKQHPLEKALDIEPGSTPPLVTLPQDTAQVPATGRTYSVTDPDTGEVVEMQVDGVTPEQLAREERVDDLRIDEQLTNVHNNAKAGFRHFMDTVDQVEPRYAARQGEVAAQFLNIALASTQTRAQANVQRKKLRIATANIGKPNSIQNNLVVADRNDILRQLLNPDREKVVGEAADTEMEIGSK